MATHSSNYIGNSANRTDNRRENIQIQALNRQVACYDLQMITAYLNWEECILPMKAQLTPNSSVSESPDHYWSSKELPFQASVSWDLAKVT